MGIDKLSKPKGKPDIKTDTIAAIVSGVLQQIRDALKSVIQTTIKTKIVEVQDVKVKEITKIYEKPVAVERQYEKPVVHNTSYERPVIFEKSYEKPVLFPKKYIVPDIVMVERKIEIPVMPEEIHALRQELNLLKVTLAEISKAVKHIPKEIPMPKIVEDEIIIEKPRFIDREVINPIFRDKYIDVPKVKK